jgi:predicted transcriptional regulator YdeE
MSLATNRTGELWKSFLQSRREITNNLPDDRPHFEVLGKNYKNNDPVSEEEIWIPVRARVTG